jgi:hypothetical protein
LLSEQAVMPGINEFSIDYVSGSQTASYFWYARDKAV